MLIKRIAVILSAVVFSTVALAQNTTSSTFPKPAFADGVFRPHMGFLMGGAQGEGALDQGVEYGIEAGYQPYIPFGLGIELSTVTAERDDLAGDDMTRTKFLVKTSYHLGGQIPILKDSYVGLAAGPMLESVGSDDDLYVGLMPNLGFDIPFERKSNDFVSAGFAARYLVSSSGNPDVFSLNGTLKYWF